MNESQDQVIPEGDPQPAPGFASRPRPTGPLITNGRRVDFGRGAAWIGMGWELFKDAPGMWILLTLVCFVLGVIGIALPLGGLIFNVVSPVLLGGLILGCDSLAHHDELEVSHLFAGFQHHLGSLLLVGFLYLVGFVAITILSGILFMLMAGGATLTALIRSGSYARMYDLFTFGAVALSALFCVLVFLALLIPLMMAYWFAPALVVIHNVEPFAAMKMSFKGSWKNFLPFLLYGLIGAFIALVASLPLMLGWLVAWPVFMGSMYASYRDIFVGDAPISSS